MVLKITEELSDRVNRIVRHSCCNCIDDNCLLRTQLRATDQQVWHLLQLSFEMHIACFSKTLRRHTRLQRKTERMIL